MINGLMTPAELVEFNELKRALTHWYKTCAAMCDTCEGCPYDTKLNCVETEAAVQRLRKAYKDIMQSP